MSSCVYTLTSMWWDISSGTIIMLGVNSCYFCLLLEEKRCPFFSPTAISSSGCPSRMSISPTNVLKYTHAQHDGCNSSGACQINFASLCLEFLEPCCRVGALQREVSYEGGSDELRQTLSVSSFCKHISCHGSLL